MHFLYWIVALTSLAVAAAVVGRVPGQLTVSHVGRFALSHAPSARTIARLMTVGQDRLCKAETVMVAAIESGAPILGQVTRCELNSRERNDYKSLIVLCKNCHARIAKQARSN
jgi:hypothetical protein